MVKTARVGKKKTNNVAVLTDVHVQLRRWCRGNGIAIGYFVTDAVRQALINARSTKKG